MYRKMRVILLVLGVSMFVANTSHSQIIFENNFDNVQTWKPTGFAACWQTTPIEGGSGACSAPGGPLPAPFNDYRHVGDGSCGVSGKNTSNIGGSSDLPLATGFSPFSGTGKAYLHWYEPCNSSSGGWGSDGLLGVYFGKTTGYSELYVQMKVRFQPGWKWTAGSQQKLMHITHFNEEVNQGVLQAYEFFNYNLPDLVPGIYYNSLYHPRPQFYLHSSHTDKTTDSPSPTPANVDISDGNWHTVKFHVKLNSAANVADGIKEMWLDGQSVVSYKNVPYTKSNIPTASAYGFNRVIIGGNANNNFTGGGEQWYAIDELVVSTIDIPTEYVIGTSGTASPPPPPQNAKGNFVK